jgi:MgtE intracellular N domain
MNTRHPRRVSRKAAEQLLDGAAGLSLGNPRAPGEPDQLARVLAAAAAPAREDELAGEQMAVAAFEASHLVPVATSQRGQMIKSPLAKLLTVKVIAGTLTVFAGGGVALAATTGTFSGPGPAAVSPGPTASASAVGGVPLASPSASVSATASATPSASASSTGPLSPAGATAAPQSSSSPAASPSASSVPQTAAALCHALISDVNGAAIQQAAQVTALASGAVPTLLSSNPEFSSLISTVQSAAAVPDYCALLLDLPQLPQPSELVQLPVNLLSQLLTQLPVATLTQILSSLPSSILSTLLTELPTSTVTQLLTELPSTVQTQILNELPTSTVTQLLNELPSSLVSTLSGLSGLTNSVASLLPGL